MRLLFTAAVVGMFLTGTACLPAAPPPSDEESIKKVLSIGTEGKNSAAAATAAANLAAGPPDTVFRLLEAFPEANPLAANLLRSAIETVVDRAKSGGEAFPVDRLATFVADTKHDPRARRLAYELALARDAGVKDRLIPGLLLDPSPELRRDAVAHWITEAERLKAAGKNDDAKAAYRKALSGAVYDDQVRSIKTALEDYGEQIDLQKHFGFITDWKIIGPFDHRGGKGFDAVYPPENEIDYDAAHKGQLGEVRWKPIATEDDYGEIDIAKQIENFKGSAMYLAAEFDAPRSQQVEVRLGTPNAWKLWVNGEFLFGRQEYHRGMELDQYKVPVTLEPGRNVILLKILQNEQSEDWAQSYKFRLRVCDATGVAVLPGSLTASE